MGDVKELSLMEKKSEWKEVTSGVPQGSVLGLVLFIIYINDLPDQMQKFCKMFADDTKLFSAIENPVDQVELQQDLFKACEWGREWLLEYNISKCKYIQFGNVKYDLEYEMISKNKGVKSVLKDREEKDLGIVFEESNKIST